MTPEYERTGSFVRLGEPVVVALTSAATQLVSVPVELAACLTDAAAARPSGDARTCNVRLLLELLDGSVLLDSQVAGPFLLAPGQTAESSAPVTLFEVSAINIRVNGAPPPQGTPVELTAGSTLPLQATVVDAAGRPLAGRTVSWTSSNSSVASVSAAGIVTGVVPGSATITATNGGRSATLAMVVRPPLDPVRVQVPSELLNGSLTVTSTPAGISCSITPSGTSGTCEALFERGSSVTLSATIGAGTVFDRWLVTDVCTGSVFEPSCTFTVPSGGRTVIAASDQLRTVRVRPGVGNVSSSQLPAVGTVTDGDGQLGAGCALSGTGFSGRCELQIPSRSSLRLTATPSSPTTNAAFAIDPCDVVSNGSGTSTATCDLSPPQPAVQTVFVQLRAPERLVVSAVGSGTGVITGNGSIACTYTGSGNTGTCAENRRGGTLAQLTASAGSGTRFVGWEVNGGPSLIPGPTLSVLMDGPRNVVAVFEPDQLSLNVTVERRGSFGGIVLSDGLIDCNDGSGICGESRAANSVARLSVIPRVLARFVGWRTDASPQVTSVPELNVLMNGPRLVTAIFEDNGITGFNASSVTFDAGGGIERRFEEVGEGSWDEIDASGTPVFFFFESGRDAFSVTLFDSSRGVTIVLDLFSEIVFYEDQATPRRPQWNIIRATAFSSALRAMP